MNKEQAMSYGVREDAYRDFQEHVSRDVNKRARELAERRKGGETAFAVAELHTAINAMVRMIHDPDRLRVILNNVNRSYAQYTQEQRKQPKTDAGGAVGCQ